jgi:cyclophilin family peptidyl-prolyl cis-trans isomerase/HEAT repeat protein
MGWILQLEDRRVLRIEPPAPPPVPAPAGKKRAAPAVPPPAALDLTRLVVDTDARIRRRAALAIGRTGLADGVAALTPVLTDTDPDVRQMAAFGLGLIGDKTAVSALTTALGDADPRVRGRAAEALGLIGDAAAAAPIGSMAAAYIKQGVLGSIGPDDEQWPKAPEVEAVRLALYALVRLKAWDPLADAILDGSGGPVSAWWPVAYALQRIEDPRASRALQRLLQGEGRYTRGFAARGLGVLKDASSTPVLVAALQRAKGDDLVSASIVRALGQLPGADGAAAVIDVLNGDATPNVKLEAVAALGAWRAHAALPVVQDLLADDWATMRAAAMRAAAAIDPDAFLLTLSGMEPDPSWTVRSALAEVLGTVSGPATIERLRPMLGDQDKRVVPAVIESLTKLHAPGLDALLLEQLKSPDTGVRTAAAHAIGEVKLAGGAAALRDAYHAWTADAMYTPRAEALDALVAFGAADAVDTLKAALADKDWAIRVHAADLLKKLDPSVETAHAIRPVPGEPVLPYTSPDLIGPPYSPHAFIETAKGTIEIELTVLDAPQTSQNFMALARKGFFNGLQIHRVVPNFVVQDGDPRGDGSGGPGYTIRDELNDRPYLRGTVGMALDWRDTGGSQFFITHSPQPHLDAKYTVFGRVVNGMEVVDRLQQLDTIQRVRIWDGKTME